MAITKHGYLPTDLPAYRFAFTDTHMWCIDWTSFHLQERKHNCFSVRTAFVLTLDALTHWAPQLADFVYNWAKRRGADDAAAFLNSQMINQDEPRARLQHFQQWSTDFSVFPLRIGLIPSMNPNRLKSLISGDSIAITFSAGWLPIDLLSNWLALVGKRFQ